MQTFARIFCGLALIILAAALYLNRELIVGRIRQDGTYEMLIIELLTIGGCGLVAFAGIWMLLRAMTK
jgi:hypothetical protein